MNELRAVENRAVKSDVYGYATGLIRAMEAKLIDRSDLAKIFETRQLDDVLRIMQDSGYEAGDGEQALNREYHYIYELLSRIMPDKGFCDALLLFNDCHNLKVVLKYLSAWWTKPEADEGKNADIPESDAGLAFQGLERMIRLPSLIEPSRLFRAVRDRQPDLIPKWLYDLALKASERYLQTYDIGRMDMLIDKSAWSQAFIIAKALSNSFFTGYLQLKSDFINLEILLRCRSLGTGSKYLEQALLQESSIPTRQLLAAYEMDPDEFSLWLKQHPMMIKASAEMIAELAEGYSKTGVAARYNKLADEKIIEWLDQAGLILRGPEIPLSYILKREMEIKNLRIALTCLRNGIPPAQARELARGNI
jgi:vacuolar-type H+-ATPase subunit C/Vma6